MRRLGILATTCCLAAGCGDDDDGGGKGRAVSVPAGATLEVAADEYSFDPSRVTVAGPGELMIELTNEGGLAHDLRLEGGGGTKIITGGERGTAQVELERGRHRFVCTVGDHEQLGMTGTLVVK